MKNNKLLLYRIVTVSLLIFFILLLVLMNPIIALMDKLPPCPFYARLHLYCPACGNTRCVKALLRGDLQTAIKYNISPIVFGVFALMGYLELATYSLGRHIKLLPRKLIYYLIVIILLLLYVGVRNFVPGMTP